MTLASFINSTMDRFIVSHWAVPNTLHNILKLFNIGLSIWWNCSMYFSSIVNIIVSSISVYHTNVKIRSYPFEKLRHNVISDWQMNNFSWSRDFNYKRLTFFKRVQNPSLLISYTSYMVPHRNVKLIFALDIYQSFCAFITFPNYCNNRPIGTKSIHARYCHIRRLIASQVSMAWHMRTRPHEL